MKPVATYQKLRGGYYTPKPIADFLAQWAIQTPTNQVLEPSCGDGSLLQAAAEVFIKRGALPTALPELLQGVEFDPQQANISLCHTIVAKYLVAIKINKCAHPFQQNAIGAILLGITSTYFARYHYLLSWRDSYEMA